MITVVGGILLPVSFLHSQFFAVLAAFVAINTLMYVTLAVAKILPRVYLSDIIPRKDRRRAPRGISPQDTGSGQSDL